MRSNRYTGLKKNYKAFCYSLSVIFISLSSIPTNGQILVTIPDTTFAAYLRSVIPSAMSGNQLDTSSSLVTVSTVSIDVSGGGITDLNGIQYFSSLRYLDCNFNSLTNLPNLPHTLSYLDCGDNNLTDLPLLDTIALTQLYCYNNLLTSLPKLSNALVTLDCHNNLITTLPGLSNSLQYLYCSSNTLTTLPALPSSLVDLECENNTLTTLPTLPSSLTYLDCSNNDLTGLPPLPNLKEFYCSGNRITCFPTLPSSINPCFYDVCLHRVFYYIDLSSNLYSCLPNYIPAMGADTTYPICTPGNLNGCKAEAGISKLLENEEQLLIHPNPSTSFFSIEMPGATNQNVQLYDLQGKLVLSQIINGKATIDANILPEGIYTLNIISSQAVINRKVIIVR